MSLELKKLDFTEMDIKDKENVKKSYVTLMQNNKHQRVSISYEECKESVRFFSNIRKGKI